MILQSFPNDVPRPNCKKKTGSNFTVHKYAMPRYMWESDHYPEFVSGSGHLIPINSVPCLYTKGLDTRYLFLDDVFVTGIVRTKCGVGLRDNSKFYLFLGKRLSKFDGRKDLVVHYVNSRESMKKLHAKVLAKN